MRNSKRAHVIAYPGTYQVNPRRPLSPKDTIDNIKD